MKKKFNKIIVLFFMLLLIISMNSLIVLAENSQETEYATLEEFLETNYSEISREEIRYLEINGTVKDYTGLSTLTNLSYLQLNNNTNLSEINFEEMPKLESLYIYDSKLNGTLNLSKNKNLTTINISLYGDLSNAVVNIKGMDWIKNFSYNYSNSTGFDLEKCILMDNYDMLDSYSNEDENGITGSCRFNVYDTIDEYLEENYPEVSRTEITNIYIYGTVKSYTGLSTLTNLNYLYLNNNTNLSEINLAELPKLETLNIYNSKLNGTLDLSKNKNLANISITLSGDLSNAVVNIKGMESIKNFNYEYSNSTGFDLNRCILMDNYDILSIYSSEEGISGGCSFSVYNTIDEYLEDRYPDVSKENITSLEFYNSNVVKDYSGLYSLPNLTSLYIDGIPNLNEISFEKVSKLKSVYISNSKLNGTLDFSKNKNLTNIEIIFEGKDLSNSVVNIKGMDWLESFRYEYRNSTGFDLKKCILMDDYNILDCYKYGEENNTITEGYSFYFEIYNTIDEYLEDYYSDFSKEDITSLNLSDYIFIKDYSGLESLTNLTSLHLNGITNLDKVSFEKASKLESVNIWDCTLNGTLDFSKNKNLTNININLSGDLSNAVVNIKGMDWIEDFTYAHYASTGFDLKKCILMDDYDILDYSVYGNEDEPTQKYSFYFEIYNTIDEYLERYYSGVLKSNIESLNLYDYILIKDYSGLDSLSNLTSLYIDGTRNLDKISFEKASKLKRVSISNCKLNGTLDFSKNKNLIDIDISLTGDLSNAVVNIKGMNWLEGFVYEYSNSTGFNLKNCILADNYDGFVYSTYKNDNITIEVYSMVKTLTDYLIENGLDTNSDGKLSDEEWKKVKNLIIDGNKTTITGIEKAVNLKSLDITNVNVNLIDFSKLSNLEKLVIYSSKQITDLTFPKMNKLEELEIIGTNNLDISNLPELKNIVFREIEGTIKFPEFKNLETFSGSIKNNKLDLSKSQKLKYAHIYDAESIKNIVFPKDKYIQHEENSDWVSIRDVEKEISIKEGGTYTYYNMEPTCENNNIIEITYMDSYQEYEVLAKKVGTTKIKLIDDLQNEIEVNVTVFDKKVDTTLENTGITSEILNYGEMILKSNGELWKVNSATTAEKTQTNVKKYVSGHVYAKDDVILIENILKKDNTLTITLKENETFEISNVADVNENLYLTTSGDLYEIDANYITEEISPNKIQSNVKRITGDCIILNDGTTWYQEKKGYYSYGPSNYYTTNDVTLKKLADFEIKDYGYIPYDFGGYTESIITVVDSNNTLWCCKEKSSSFNDSGLEILQTNFKGYGEEEEYNYGWNLNLENGNAVLHTTEYNEETQEYEIVSSKIILTDVYQLGSSMWSDVIVRKDGSLWLYDRANGLTKITESTIVEDEGKVEEEEKEELPFTDVSKDIWYYKAVEYVYEKGMIKGTSDTTFSPNGDLTRGMLVTILWRMEGSPKVTSNQFKDVSSSQYYYDAVNWAASKKIVNGYENGKFGPNDKITREQLAVMLRNYSIYKKKDVSARADLSKFKDSKYISGYAKDAVSWAVANKIISGKTEGTRIDPHGKATRAEAASMLYSYCMNIK